MVSVNAVIKDVKTVMTNGTRFLYNNKNVAKAEFIGCVRIANGDVVTNIFDHNGKGDKQPNVQLCALSQNGKNGYPTGIRANNAKPHEITIDGKKSFWFDYR